MNIFLNGKPAKIPKDWADESLLFVLREYFELVAAKYGCGRGQCGACTIIVDGEAVRSCIIPASAIEEAEVRTLEGLAHGGVLHPVQNAWLEHAVPQCGYCQAGQIMSAVALLDQNPLPTPEDVESAMEGNLCRCGTYARIRTAIKSVADQT